MTFLIQILGSIAIAAGVEAVYMSAASNSALRRRAQDLAGTTDWTLRFKDRARYLASMRYARPAFVATFMKTAFFVEKANPNALFIAFGVFAVAYAIAYASLGPTQNLEDKQ